jgi:hypothetical protein
MVKRIFCLTALLAVLIASGYQSAWAQKHSFTQKPVYQSIQQYGPFTKVNFKGSNKDPLCPSGWGAGGCLFNGGYFLENPNLPPYLPNGLANGTNLLYNPYGEWWYGAAVWVPFTVPNGVTWTVEALYTNNLSFYGMLDQYPMTPTAAAFYAVSSGVASGNQGYWISYGTAAATSTPTGISAFGLSEYTIAVDLATQNLTFPLTAGEYWMAVVPICTNVNDTNCTDVSFLDDVEYVNGAPAGRRGQPEPIDSAYFDSPLVFYYSFWPAYGPSGTCFGYGCDAFNAGICGTHSP